MQTITVRPVKDTDYAFILRVNEENVEMLSPMDEEKLRDFQRISTLFWVAEVDGEPAGFLIALTEGASSYQSENYLWFQRQYPRFLYIDRVVLDRPYRRIGLGKTLYEKVFGFAKEQKIPVVTAEVDTIPYNGASLQFHRAMGFLEVGTQFVRNGSVKVSLQAADMAKHDAFRA